VARAFNDILEMRRRKWELEELVKNVTTAGTPEGQAKVEEMQRENDLFNESIHATTTKDFNPEHAKYIELMDTQCLGENIWESVKDDNDYAYAVGCGTNFVVQQEADYLGHAFSDSILGSNPASLGKIPRQKRSMKPVERIRHNLPMSYELHVRYQKCSP